MDSSFQPLMKLQRRAYAERAVKNLRSRLKKHGRVLAVSPTGSGKTVIAAMICKEEKRARVLFVAHRYELIDQTYRTLTSLGLECGVLMAADETLHKGERTNRDARIQVASIQTLDRRGVPDGIDLLIVDESHRIMSDSYQRIAETCKKARVLGLTATPVRMDGRGLGDFFKHMYEVAKPSELHKDGHLANPRAFSAPADMLDKIRSSLRGIPTTGGDYAPAALVKAVDQKFLVGKVVGEAIRLAPGVPKVVFACGVKHSQRIVAGFKRRGVKAAHLDANTDPHERARIIEALRSGELEVVSNVDVLSEGWDLPALGAVILARPTKSLARYLQMSGRCTRPYKGRVPLVIDHGANVHRFQVLPGTDIPWSLEYGLGDEADSKENIKECVSCLEFIPYGTHECPSCGAEQPKTVREEREEIQAQLEEITRAKMQEMRARLEELAVKKGAPVGWVDRVMRDVVL